MKKKTNKVLLLFIAVILGILFFKYFGSTFTTIPISSGTSSSPFLCPSGAGYSCNVKGIMDCNQQSGTVQIVTARAKDSAYGSTGHWLSVTDQFGNLKGFSRMTEYTNTGGIPRTSPVNLPFGVTGYYWNGGTSTCNGVNCIYIPIDSTHFKRYVPSSACEPTCSNPAPTGSGGTCAVNELCSGGTTYSCSGSFKVKQSQSSPTVLYSENLVYSSGSPGTRESTQRNIQSGNVVEVTGGSLNKVQYEVVQTPACTQGATRCTSDFSAVEECLNGVYTPVDACNPGESCQESSTGAYCLPRFNLDYLKLRNAQDTSDVTAYTPDQQVNVKFRILTSETAPQVKIKLFKDETQVAEYSVPYSGNQLKTFSFDTPDTAGSYKVALQVLYGGQVITLGEAIFSISPVAIESNFRAYTQLIDSDTDGVFTSSNNFYTNNPLTVEFRVFRAGDSNNLVAIDSHTVTATLNNQPFTLPTPDIAVGLIKYSLNLPQQGILRLQGRATSSGIQSPLSSIDLDVKTPEVRVQFTNDDNLASLTPGTSADILFETRSAIGNLIDTTNTVTVLITGGTEQTISGVTRTSQGKYKIPYTFGSSSDTGQKAFQFFISSSAQNHLTSAKTSSSLISVSSSNPGIQECTQDSQCSTGETCENGKCVSGDIPLTFYYIVFFTLAILVLVVIIFIVKRRQSNFNF